MTSYRYKHLMFYPAVLLVMFLAGTHPVVGDIQSGNGSLFDPNAATVVNGDITVASGQSITFDTSGEPPSFSGTYSGNGELATSQGGSVTQAMFTFKSLIIQAGATVAVTGTRGIVLASRNNMTIAGGIEFNLNGVDGSASSGGAGGPGGYAGGFDESAGSGPGGGGATGSW